MIDKSNADVIIIVLLLFITGIETFTEDASNSTAKEQVKQWLKKRYWSLMMTRSYGIV